MVGSDEVGAATSTPPRATIKNPPPATVIDAFFRAHWKDLVLGLIGEGATLWEAEEAVAEALQDALPRWATIADPVTRIRRSARALWIAERISAGPQGRELLVADVTAFDAAVEDTNELTVYEIREWLDGVVTQLPPARQQALRLSAKGLTPQEIAARVDKSPVAIRAALSTGRHQANTLRNSSAGPPRPRTATVDPAPDVKGETDGRA